MEVCGGYTFEKIININDDQIFKVHLFDLYNCQPYQAMIRDNCIHDVNVIWLCFDLLRMQSFKSVLKQYQYIMSVRKNVCIIFFGCKNDL